VNFKNSLAVSFMKLGEIYKALGNLTKTLYFFEKNVILAKELNERYPTNVNFKTDLAVSYVKLAFAYSETDIKKTKVHFEKAEKHFAELQTLSPENARFKQYLADVRKFLKMLEDL
jgi:tetratricopeptide (TPR) repeat protein